MDFRTQRNSRLHYVGVGVGVGVSVGIGVGVVVGVYVDVAAGAVVGVRVAVGGTDVAVGDCTTMDTANVAPNMLCPLDKRQ